MVKEEFRSSPEVGTGFVKGNTFEYRAVQYSVIDGEAIFEGDIVLGSIDEMERLVAEVNEGKDKKNRAVDHHGLTVPLAGGRCAFHHRSHASQSSARH